MEVFSIIFQKNKTIKYMVMLTSNLKKIRDSGMKFTAVSFSFEL